jgi:hypothetical protein
LMRPSPALRSIMQTPLTDAIEGSRPGHGRLVARVVRGLIRGYKVLISPLFTGSVPIPAVVFRLHGGSRRAPWCSARSLAGSAPTLALPAFRRPRVRSGTEIVDPLHGTQGFHRHLVVIRRALRLPGALRAAPETGGGRRREERTPARCSSRSRGTRSAGTSSSTRACRADCRNVRAHDCPRDHDVGSGAHQPWRSHPPLATQGLSR